MTEQMEQQLRELFSEDADRAPQVRNLAIGAVRLVRQRRRTTLAWAAGGSVITVAAVAALVGSLPGGDHDGSAISSPSPRTSLHSTPSSTPARGAVPGSDTASCVEAYSAKTLVGQAFAFDGTVIALGPARTNRPGGGQLPLVAVTFGVHEWFHGGSGESVTIDMSPPLDRGEDGVPSYDVGTRLLVSGQPRWGGAPLDDAIAWGCGFTRYYDSATADLWQHAFK